MDDEKLQKLLVTLRKSTSKQTIFANLKILRSVVSDKKQFTNVLKNGGLRICLQLLIHHKKVEIVDIILSILGNCCLNKDCVREVFICHGLRTLASILEKWKEDSVLCRACRIIGNIAQFGDYVGEIFKYSIVPRIVHILGRETRTERILQSKEDDEYLNKISMGTQLMAVRALRLIWNSVSNRQSMINDKTIRAVSLVMINNTTEWKKNEDKEPFRSQRVDLLKNILKCILLFSKVGTLECAQQILADGNGFKSLVALIDIDPYSSVKSLTNLSHVATSRSDVHNAAAVECVVNKLKIHVEKYPSEKCPYNYLNAFALLCRHPMNCAEIKKYGGLELMLTILKSSRSRRQEYLIVTALSNFNYDKISQKFLCANGLVGILIDCIERNLKLNIPLDHEHSIKRETVVGIENCNRRKRTRDTSSPQFQTNPSRPHSSIQIISGRMTPSDSDSSPMSSPPCTPPRKKFLWDNSDNINDDDSDNYSPVCSDSELEENKEEDSSLSNTDLSALNQICGLKSQYLYTSMEERSIVVMLNLLSCTYYVEPFPKELLDPKTTITMLKYVRESKYQNSRATQILNRIFRDEKNLVQLISGDMMAVLKSMQHVQHELTKCARCYRLHSHSQELLKKLGKSVETDEGQQILLEEMAKDNVDFRMKCVMAVPHFIRDKSVLQKLMINFCGLELLLQNFLNNKELRCDAFYSLSKLAIAICVNNPCSEAKHLQPLMFTEKYQLNPSAKNIVIINLDDGTSVAADRDFLVEKVDYFKAMLSGSFREADQDSIILKNVSNNALNFLLILLANDYEKLEPYPLQIDVNVILEVITLTDSYILEGLTDWLTRCVELYMISINTAVSIYKWSLMSRTNILGVETVAYVLTSEMTDSQRSMLCESMVENDVLFQLNEDIHNLILRYLKLL